MISGPTHQRQEAGAPNDLRRLPQALRDQLGQVRHVDRKHQLILTEDLVELQLTQEQEQRRVDAVHPELSGGVLAPLPTDLVQVLSLIHI